MPFDRTTMLSSRHAILLVVAFACRGGDTPSPAAATGESLATMAAPESGSCQADPAGGRPICLIPIARLLARPQDYHGKRVDVMGFAHYEFEGNGLYLNRDDAEHWMTYNGFWLDPPNREVANSDSLSDQYVLITGTFDANNKGHLGMWSGAIVDITHAQRLPFRSLSRAPDRIR